MHAAQDTYVQFIPRVFERACSKLCTELIELSHFERAVPRYYVRRSLAHASTMYCVVMHYPKLFSFEYLECRFEDLHCIRIELVAMSAVKRCYFNN